MLERSRGIVEGTMYGEGLGEQTALRLPHRERSGGISAYDLQQYPLSTLCNDLTCVLRPQLMSLNNH